MAAIARIEARIVTVDSSNAGTDGDVYLGICGREFYLDTSIDKFERGQIDQIILGEGSNLSNGRDNNPRRPQLFTENLFRFPVYIRFAPERRTDNWFVESVNVTVNPGPGQAEYTVLGGDDKLWLGARSGLFIHLFPVVIE